MRRRDDRGLRPYLDGAAELGCGHSQGVAVEREAQLQSIQHFEWMHPHFDRASFVPERRAAAPDHVEERSGRQAALQGQARLGEWKSRGPDALRPRPRRSDADHHERGNESASHGTNARRDSLPLQGADRDRARPLEGALHKLVSSDPLSVAIRSGTMVGSEICWSGDSQHPLTPPRRQRIRLA